MKKKILSLALAAIVAVSGFAAIPVSADDGDSNYGSSNYNNSNYSSSNYSDSNYGDSNYGKKTYKMKRVGKAKRTVKVGQEFELKVKKTGALEDDHLKWSIGNKNIVKFDDDDITDDEVELKARKAGTTKVTCYNKKTKGKIVYTVTVKKNKTSYTISRVGKATRVVEKGDDFELKVKKSPALKNGQIKWTIGNTKILKFEDGDRYGAEVELEAKRTGTTKVTCKNLKTGGKIVYTIKVVRDDD